MIANKFLKFLFIAFVVFSLLLSVTMAKPKPGKVKFYNFDDLLINGEYKKPQVLYTDARQKVRFEKLLKLKKEFLSKLKATSKDPALK
jgi:hypothetical protein